MSETENSRSQVKNHRGFTLMELMIVIVILGILMAIVAPRFMAATDEAKRLDAKGKCDACSQAVQRYYMKYSKLPSDLQSLTEPDEKNYGDPWIDKRDIRDPWGNDLEMRVEGSRKVEILSFGADGTQGGTDLIDQDISSKRPLDELDEDS